MTLRKRPTVPVILILTVGFMLSPPSSATQVVTLRPTDFENLGTRYRSLGIWSSRTSPRIIDPFDQVAFDNIFIGAGTSKDSRAQLLAFVETMTQYGQFKDSAAALNHLDEAVGRYSKLNEEKTWANVIHGLFDVGLTLTDSFEDGKLRFRPLVEAALKTYYVASDAIQIQDQQLAGAFLKDVRAKRVNLKLFIGMNPEMATPLLQRLYGTQSDQDYRDTLARLPMTLGSGADMQASIEGTVQDFADATQRKIEMLTERLTQQGADVTAIRAEIETLSRNMEKLFASQALLAKAVEESVALATQQQAESRRAAAAERFRQHSADVLAAFNALAPLLNLPAKHVNDVTVFANAASKLAAGLVSEDPFAIAAGGANLLSLLVGPESETATPYQQIADQIREFRREMHERFDRLELGLTTISQQIGEMRKEVLTKLDDCLTALDTLQRTINTQRALLASRFFAIEDVLEADFYVKRNEEWAEFLKTADAVDRDYFAKMAARRLETDRFERSNEDALRRAFGKIEARWQYDRSGLGHPIIAGPTNCLDALTEKVYSGDVTFEVAAANLGRVLDEPQYGGQAHCVSSLETAILLSVPSMPEPREALDEIGGLPLRRDTGKLGVDARPLVGSPAIILEMARETGDVLRSLRSLQLRGELSERLLLLEEPGVRRLRLWRSKEGNRLLALGQLAMVEKLSEFVGRLFLGDYMRGVAAFEAWKEGFLQHVANPVALYDRATFHADVFTGAIVNMPPLVLDDAIIKAGFPRACAIEPFEEFIRTLTHVRTRGIDQMVAEVPGPLATRWAGAPGFAYRIMLTRGLPIDLASSVNALPERLDDELDRHLRSGGSGGLEDELRGFVERALIASAVERWYRKRSPEPKELLVETALGPYVRIAIERLGRGVPVTAALMSRWIYTEDKKNAIAINDRSYLEAVGKKLGHEPPIAPFVRLGRRVYVAKGMAKGGRPEITDKEYVGWRRIEGFTEDHYTLTMPPDQSLSQEMIDKYSLRPGGPRDDRDGFHVVMHRIDADPLGVSRALRGAKRVRLQLASTPEVFGTNAKALGELVNCGVDGERVFGVVSGEERESRLSSLCELPRAMEKASGASETHETRGEVAEAFFREYRRLAYEVAATKTTAKYGEVTRRNPKELKAAISDLVREWYRR